MGRRWQTSSRELGDKPFELILVELKGQHAATKGKVRVQRRPARPPVMLSRWCAPHPDPAGFAFLWSGTNTSARSRVAPICN